jgi:ferredoxin-thioredoxin reductase catalytic subunit
MGEAAVQRDSKPPKDLETCIQETRTFVGKVVDRFDLAFNPDPEVNETIIQGLARHQHLHGRRYCPCFIIQFDKALDRICPCKPGLEEEIPRDGHCHCGIFCAKDYAKAPEAWVAQGG